ncbi:MAG: DUF2480 family protein [Chitinophagaceae bacterium]
MEESILNKVSESGIITLDPEQYFPTEEIVSFDLTPFLFRGLILKEKEFRESMLSLNWSNYFGKTVAVFCSSDAIIPAWAHMLVASKLSGIAHTVYAGTKDELEKKLFLQNLEQIKPADYIDKRVVVKGCGDKQTGAYAYLEITRKLIPVVKSLMYGEPCSTVPVYKKK